MPESLTQLSALTVFLLIAGAGFLFLVLVFALNDLFEALGIDFHFGHADADLSADTGVDGIGLLDARVLSIFVTALGCFGAIGVQLGLGTGLSTLVGFVGGLLLGAAVYYFGKLLHQQQASSSVSAHDLIGRLAEVTVTIPAGNLGRVICVYGEERVEKLARSRDEVEIKIGTPVRIEALAGEAVIVSADDSAHRLYLSTG